LVAPVTEARASCGPIAAPKVQVTWAMPLASVSDVAAPIEPPLGVVQVTLTCSAGWSSRVTSTRSGWASSA
jgi:hypothetical protein